MLLFKLLTYSKALSTLTKKNNKVWQSYTNGIEVKEFKKRKLLLWLVFFMNLNKLEIVQRLLLLFKYFSDFHTKLSLNSLLQSIGCFRYRSFSYFYLLVTKVFCFRLLRFITLNARIPYCSQARFLNIFYILSLIFSMFPTNQSSSLYCRNFFR